MFKTSHINFDWKYISNFKEEYIKHDFDDSSFEIVNIPHSNITIPYNNFDEKIYQFESCYRKEIWIDTVENKEKIYIKFEGVMTYAKVYLNGNYVGEHKGGYTPFRLELTEYAKLNSYNTLVVYVDSREIDDIPPFGFVVDYLTYGGIYREVSLEYCNMAHIETIGIRTKDLLTHNPKLSLDLYIHNGDKQAKVLNCRFKIIEDENIIYEFHNNLNLNKQSY